MIGKIPQSLVDDCKKEGKTGSQIEIRAADKQPAGVQE